jgi:hypothetical protein
MIKLRRKGHPDKPSARRELMRCGFNLIHSTDFERWKKPRGKQVFGLVKVKRHYDIAQLT